MEDDLKIVKVEISASTEWILTRGKFRGNPECGSAQPSLFHYLV